MKILTSFFMFLVMLNAYANDSISFSKNGELVKSFTVKELIQKLSTHKVTVKDPVSREFQVFETVKLIDVLKMLYGNKWGLAKQIAFQSKTKYSPSMDIKLLTQREGHLAFKRVDGGGFKIVTRTTNKIVELKPFFLIWSNTKLKNKKDFRWIYQLIKIDLIYSNEKPGVYPLGKNSGPILKGYNLFNKYCLRCHSLNGIGGEYAPDLLTNASFVNRGKKGISRYMENPKKYNQYSKMPSLKIYLPNKKTRQSAIINIVNYLEYLMITNPKERRPLNRRGKSDDLKKLLN